MILKLSLISISPLDVKILDILIKVIPAFQYFKCSMVHYVILNSSTPTHGSTEILVGGRPEWFSAPQSRAKSLMYGSNGLHYLRRTKILIQSMLDYKLNNSVYLFIFFAYYQWPLLTYWNIHRSDYMTRFNCNNKSVYLSAPL